MRLSDLKNSFRRRVQQAYHRALSKLARMIREIVKTAKTPQELTDGLKQLDNSKAFHDYMDAAVGKMITMTKQEQAKTWRQAASESSHGREIYELLRENTTGAVALTIDQIIAENSLLISTVPQNIAERMSRYMYEQTMKGIRPEDMMDWMRKEAPHLADWQLRRIARTQSSKAQTALTQARSEELGLDWYVWETSHDGVVRDSHAAMQGIYCRWSDPPNPEALFPGKNKPRNAYHPGGIYNCRCIALPVVDAHDLQFPIRAHVHGKIVTIGNMKAWVGLNGGTTGYSS